MSSQLRAQLRRSAEARAWRLALLLTRDAEQAAEVAIQVRKAQPRLERLDPRRLDRLVVLRSREVAQRRRRRAAPAADAAPAPERVRPLLDALRRLGHQVQEAWIFARVDELGEIEMARAMDCSKSAAARFLAEADSALAAVDELPARIEALRNWLASLAPLEAIEARRAVHRRRRRMKLTAWLVGAAAIGGAGIAAILAIL
ncbi:MAG: hypothetical protein ACF8R7_07800 [Phycisphaerales bacterium JB039]